MGNIENLSHLRCGQSASVSSLLTCGAMRRRLQDMGLIEGTHVVCLRKAPLGDPTAYEIRGAVIALRREDSAKILVNLL